MCVCVCWFNRLLGFVGSLVFGEVKDAAFGVWMLFARL